MIKKFFIFTAIIFLPGWSRAAIRQIDTSFGACHNPYLRSEVSEYNQDFQRQGFILRSFHLLHFPKNSYVPVKIHLEKDNMYQINFVADRFFQQVTITLMGKGKQIIFQEKFKGKTSQQHWFSKSVAAPYTGDYWVILSQKAKGKDTVCGGLSVMEASGGND